MVILKARLQMWLIPHVREEILTIRHLTLPLVVLCTTWKVLTDLGAARLDLMQARLLR